VCVVAALEAAAVGQEREAGKRPWALSHGSPVGCGQERVVLCSVPGVQQDECPAPAWLTHLS